MFLPHLAGKLYLFSWTGISAQLGFGEKAGMRLSDGNIKKTGTLGKSIPCVEEVKLTHSLVSP